MKKINLFCLPFAGGSRYSYISFANCAPENICVIPIELPGRGSRFRETLLTNMDSVVTDIFQQIKDRLDEPYGIYGHSMGTLSGYLLTKKIIQKNLNKPIHLFFTG